MAGVISNYSIAGIPLETMWTDIGEWSSIVLSDLSTYDSTQTICISAESLQWIRNIFHMPACVRSSTIYISITSVMVCLVSYISSITYDVAVSVLMTDPAIGYLPNQGYEPYDRGTQLDLWLKTPNGGPSLGVVWPGMVYQFGDEKNSLNSFIQVSPFSPVRTFYSI